MIDTKELFFMPEMQNRSKACQKLFTNAWPSSCRTVLGLNIYVWQIENLCNRTDEFNHCHK